jgi:transcriptional regulator with XRE-family HTH domain
MRCNETHGTSDNALRQEDSRLNEFSFGAWLRRRRKVLRLTRVALAAVVGCAEVTLAKIERDERRPSQQLAERLADALVGTMVERRIFMRAARHKLAVDHMPVPAEHAQELLNATMGVPDATLVQLILAALQPDTLALIGQPQRILVLDLPSTSAPSDTMLALICLVRR